MTIGEPQNATSDRSEALQGVVTAIQELKESIGTDRMTSIVIDTEQVRPIDKMDEDFAQYQADRWDS